jgi:hypothetical protein
MQFVFKDIALGRCCIIFGCLTLAVLLKKVEGGQLRLRILVGLLSVVV